MRTHGRDVTMENLQLTWTEELNALLTEYERSEITHSTSLLAMPRNLISTIENELPGFLCDGEADFEMDFVTLCERHGAIGSFLGRPIQLHLISAPPAPSLTEATMESLGWNRYWPPTEAEFRTNQALERIDPFKHQLVAYLGWLLTNKAYRSDVARLRDKWEVGIVEYGSFPEVGVVPGEDESVHGPDVSRIRSMHQEFTEFYSKWQLLRLVTWDLPLPAGPNLGGPGLGPAQYGNIDQVRAELPVTIRLQARSPIRETLSEAAQSETSPHLREWAEIIDRSDGQKFGPRSFNHKFWIHFVLNLILRSRYLDRLAGKLGALDRAIADYLGDIGEESVRKLRQHLDRQIGPTA